MARVTFTGFQGEYAARNATAINAVWSAFQTQSTNVDEENIADGGIDQRNIVAGTATDGYEIKSYSGVDEVFTFGPWVAFPTYNDIVFTAGPVTMNLTNGGAGWAVGAGVGQVRVRFCANFQIDLGGRVAVTTDTIRFRLRYTTNLGNVTPSLVQTQHVAYTEVAGAPVGAPSDLNFFRDAVSWVYLIPLGGGVTSISDIRVQATTDAPTSLTIGRCSLSAVRFLKVA